MPSAELPGADVRVPRRRATAHGCAWSLIFGPPGPIANDFASIDPAYGQPSGPVIFALRNARQRAVYRLGRAAADSPMEDETVVTHAL